MEPEVLKLDETPVEEPKPKKNHSFTIILVIGLLLIALTSFVSYKKGFSKRDVKTNETKLETNNSNKKVEDQNIIDKINYKLKLLRINDIRIIGETYQGKTLDITNYNNKEHIIFNYLFGEDSTPKKANRSEYPDLANQLVDTPYGEYFTIDPFPYVTKDEFVNTYKDLFGIEPQNKDYYDIVYLDNDGIYVDTLQNEGDRANKGLNREQKYVYLVAEDDKNYYAYFSYVEYSGFTMYKTSIDYINNNPFIDCGDEPDCAKKDEFKLTESNYKEFQKYKVTFEKKDNDFYLKYIDRIIE